MSTKFLKTSILLTLITVCTLLPTQEAKAWKLFGKQTTFEQGYINEDGCPYIYKEFKVYFMGILIDRGTSYEPVDPECGNITM